MTATDAPAVRVKPKWPVGGYAPGKYMCICVHCGQDHIADKRATICADCIIQALLEPADLAPAAPALAVWYGEMPESNGRRNWTASLHQVGRDPHVEGFCFARSEYPDRVRYAADRMRWVVGIGERPDILAYDDDLHSGYVEPADLAPDVAVLARGHSVALRQCAILAADHSDEVAKCMTDAADFLAAPSPAPDVAALREALEAVDAFMAGQKLTDRQHELQRSVAVAGSFAAAAYEAAPRGGADVHALMRTFLIAMIDPDDPALDYLRAAPSSGQEARDASARLAALAALETKP